MGTSTGAARDTDPLGGRGVRRSRVRPYGMLLLEVTAVCTQGLMIGRTPEFRDTPITTPCR